MRCGPVVFEDVGWWTATSARLSVLGQGRNALQVFVRSNCYTTSGIPKNGTLPKSNTKEFALIAK